MESLSKGDLIDHIHQQRWFLQEYKTRIKRAELLHNIRYDLPKNEIINLHSSVLTPELKVIATSMYIPNISSIAHVNRKTWAIQNSNSHNIACNLGGWGAVESVIQLPAKSKRLDATVIFNSVGARKSALYNINKNIGPKASKPQYSLNNFPKLKFQVRCLNNIFKELLEENIITSYNLNNFAASNHNEFVFPLYSFRVEGETKNTKFLESRCIPMYKENGFLVPLDDVNFNSNEYLKLKSTIQDHVFEHIEMQRRPSNPTLLDHLKNICPNASFTASASLPGTPQPTPTPFPTYPLSEPPTQVYTSSTNTTADEICWPKIGQNFVNNPLISGSNEQFANQTNICNENITIDPEKSNSNHKVKTYIAYPSDNDNHSPIDLNRLLPLMPTMAGPQIIIPCTPSKLPINSEPLTNLLPLRIEFSD